MTIQDFENVINSILSELKSMADENDLRIINCKKGEHFEVIVYDLLKDTLKRLEFPSAEVKYQEGSHAFPDIVIEHGNLKYGIEVKCSVSKSKSWKINGNSVTGSTKDKEVTETYIIFGKPKLKEFRAGKYENCIANVAVTHSPRFMVDMDLTTGNTFFDNAGISYEEFSQAEEPIELVKNYFRDEGKTAWWLSESSPAAIRMLNELPENECAFFIAYSLVHYPEIVISDHSSHGEFNKKNKYNRCTQSLIVEHSIISPCFRDKFSAGGKKTVELKGIKFPKVPRIYATINDHKYAIIDIFNHIDLQKLKVTWAPFISDIESVLHDDMDPESLLQIWIDITTALSNPEVENWDKIIKAIFA